MRKSIAKGAALIYSIITLTSVGGVFATWAFANGPAASAHQDIPIHVNEFTFAPSMPDAEVTLLQRLYDILNRIYTTENVQDARTYLLEETIRVEWEYGAAPYVGSMDKDFEVQLNELFGDILDTLNVSFILKNQDLNYDGYNEVSLYSTSDPLDCVETRYNGIVGVYVSVFTPVVDAAKNIIGYELVCDSLYGFCNEVHYNPQNPDKSSFSTDDWRDNLVYWHHELDTQPMPDDALGSDGKTLFKYHYESYHSMKYAYEGYPWGATSVWIQGRTASQILAGQIPWIG